MTKADFEHLVTQLQQGNNQPLKQLQAYQQDVIGMLRNRSKGSCALHDAEDIFIDGVMAFRQNVLQGKAVYQNVKGYLATICWNKWLERSRSRQRKLKKQDDIKRQLYVVKEETYDPLVKQEETQEALAATQARIIVLQQAMAKLSAKCQQILHLSIVEEVSMKMIAEQMGFASANVAKTTKSRCYRKLIGMVK